MAKRSRFLEFQGKRQEIKADLDLVKYLHKNESDPKLKARLAMLGSRLNNIFIHI